MLLQKIFLQINDKYSITNDEINDLFDIEICLKDSNIYKLIINRYESVLQKKFEAMYREAKKYKNKLVSFFKIVKWKNAVNSSIEHDLFLNSFDDFSNKYIVTILEKNTIYKFRISDIVNLWVLALKNNEQMFVRPICVKNPYTNIELSKTALYNIYFKLLDTGFIVPNVITSHIQHGLDIKMFCIRNYPELKENAIVSFMREANYLDKYEHVLNMLHDYRKDIDYYTMASLCSNRIKRQAVNLFSNHLFLYLESKFSCNPLIKDESKSRVKEKLKKLIEEKPLFGFTRLDVIRYVPVSERSNDRRRSRSRRISSIVPSPPPPPPISDITPPPLPNILRRRRNSLITPPPLPPPPPPQTLTPIVRTYTGNIDSENEFPELQINNFITRSNDILTRTLTNNNTQLLSDSILNTPIANTTITNNPIANTTITNNPIANTTITNNNLNENDDIFQSIISSRDRARDILSQIDEILDSENETLNDFELTVEIENPFLPSRELTRTPPPQEESEVVVPLLSDFNVPTTREIIERLNTVINNELQNANTQTNTQQTNTQQTNTQQTIREETIVEEINDEEQQND